MDQENWMKKCVPHFIGKGKDQDQAVAACITMYDQGDTVLEDAPVVEKKAKDKYQVMSDLKKVIEKNNLKCSDEILEKLFMELQEGGIEMSIAKVTLDKGADKQIIKIFPRKNIYVEKYKHKFSFNDAFFTEIIKNFENIKLFKPFGDEQHQLGVKFFDIVSLFSNEEGLFAEIELNTLGMEAIRNREYSYISPQWGERTDTEGHIYKNVLMAITLTNIPALEGELPTLQEQITLSKERKMEIEKKLVELSTKVAGYKLAAGDVPAIDPTTIDPAALIGLLDECMSMMDEMKAKIAEVTGAQQVAEETAEAAKSELEKIKAEADKKETDEFFEMAIKEGKILPGEEVSYRKLYSMDKVSVSEIIAQKQTIEEFKLSGNSEPSNVKLDKLDYDIMAERGLDKNNKDHVKSYLDANK